MKIIRNRFVPFGKFSAINLLGIMFVKSDVSITPRLINHESIHTAQMRELFYIPFYVLYLVEWVIRLLQTGNFLKAYYAVSFEKEAYENDGNRDYLSIRKPYAQWRRDQR